MKFSTFLSTGLVAFGLLSSSACAAAVEKRDAVSEAQAALQSATGKVTGIGGRIAAAVLVTDFNDEDQVKSNIVPLVQGIVDAVSEAASTINGLAEASGDGSARYLVKRQNAAVVAAALVALIQSIYNALLPLIVFLQSIPLVQTLLGQLLAGLNANLIIIATGLGILLAGVLNVVRDLLASLAGALSGIGLGGFLGVIGL